MTIYPRQFTVSAVFVHQLVESGMKLLAERAFYIGIFHDDDIGFRITEDVILGADRFYVFRIGHSRGIRVICHYRLISSTAPVNTSGYESAGDDDRHGYG